MARCVVGCDGGVWWRKMTRIHLDLFNLILHSFDTFLFFVLFCGFYDLKKNQLIWYNPHGTILLDLWALYVCHISTLTKLLTES